MREAAEEGKEMAISASTSQKGKRAQEGSVQSGHAGVVLGE